MPFDFLKRKKADGPAAAKAASARQEPIGPRHPVRRADRGVADRRQHGDHRPPVGSLNKREAVTISDVRWAPINGSEPLAPAPGLKAIDPYDLIIVLASEASLAAAERRGADGVPGPQGVV